MSIAHRQLDFYLLIPCYDDLDRLILSLNSVSYYPDRFAVVVVDDGSAVPITIKAIRQTTTISASIIILRNEENQGITNALNKGLEWIERNGKANYVARLDCGDVCHERRFYKQIDYMDEHADIVLVGSWCIFQSSEPGVYYQYKTPVYHEQIKRAMHIRNVFIHPTVIFKSDAAKKTGYYTDKFKYAEDYAFFWKLIKLGSSHILNEFLVTCAIDNKGISLQNRGQQLDSRARIIATYGSNFLLKMVGILRTKVLHIMPKRLALLLKKTTNL